MEATQAALKKHATRINAVLKEVCEVAYHTPLIQEIDGTIVISPSSTGPLSRQVTSDLGARESALRLPIPDAHHPRFWITLGERWEWKQRNRVRFQECGLRLYVGEESEEAIQFLRLEWSAPTLDNGEQLYPGKHAGHPHWHIDRSALIGPEDSLRALEALTAPSTSGEQVEDFTEATLATAPARKTLDCSWLQKMHLPAEAQWMKSEWDGQKIPGPHQSEPNSLEELTHWWAGALRYISRELPR